MSFSAHDRRRIAAQTRRLERVCQTALALPDGAGPVARPPVSFGKPLYAFSGGTTITLNPTDSAGNDIPQLDDVICHLSPDASSVAASWTTSTVLRFARYPIPDANGVGGILLGLWAQAALGFDRWVNVTGDGLVSLDAGDWRGYALPVQVMAYVGTAANARTAGWVSLDRSSLLAQGGMAGDTCVTSQTTLWRDDTGRSIEVFLDNAGGYVTAGRIALSVYSEASYPLQVRVRVGNPPLILKSAADLTI